MFDLSTLRLISMVSYIGFMFATLMLWHFVPQERSLRDWATSTVLLAIGMLLLGLRGVIPDFISITIANTLTVLGIGFMYVGTQGLLGAEKGRAWHWYAGAAAFLICIFAPNISVRVTGTSLLYAPFLFACTVLFWRQSDIQIRATARLTALLLGVGVVLFVVRAISPPELPSPALFISTSSLVEVMPYAYAILISMWLPLSLMLIVNIRLQKQRADALERAETAILELKESEFHWKFAIEGSGDGVWDWNIRTNDVHYSRRWKEMLGYSDADILPTNDEWVTRIYPEDCDYVAATMQAYLEGKTEVYVVEYRLRCKDDSYKWILGRGMVVSRSEDGTPLRMIGTHTDITASKQMEEQVRQLAFYDPLTGLPNRRLLNDRLSQLIVASKRSGCYGALMFLDLDNFKPLNDVYGHAAGDLLLVEAARRLEKCVREMDTVARFGGDEFVVMLAELDEDRAVSTSRAKIVAEKIRAVLSEPYFLTIKRDGMVDMAVVEHYCTASIGMALFVDHAGNHNEILKWADAAMYRAKDAGRNMIHVYDAGMIN